MVSLTKKLHTKWGNARIVKGHYQIISGKEGNYGKKLYKLIWEDLKDKMLKNGKN